MRSVRFLCHLAVLTSGILLLAYAGACGGSNPAGAAQSGSGGSPAAPAIPPASSTPPPPSPPAAGGALQAAPIANAAIAGIAFVSTAVTSRGSRAKLPEGTVLYPPGSRIAGTTGCATNPYGTDGQIVAVLDYTGRPTAASVVVRRAGAGYERPPYYIDLDTGRTLQFLGPERENGTYRLDFEYHAEQGRPVRQSAEFTLDRTCPAVQ